MDSLCALPVQSRVFFAVVVIELHLDLGEWGDIFEVTGVRA